MKQLNLFEDLVKKPGGYEVRMSGKIKTWCIPCIDDAFDRHRIAFDSSNMEDDANLGMRRRYLQGEGHVCQECQKEF